MQPKLLLVLCLLLFTVEGITQEIRENENGEKIVVYPDGSWRYFNERIRRAPGTFPVVKDTIKALDNPSQLTEEIALKMANRISQIAHEANLIAQVRVDEAKRQRERIEKEMGKQSNQQNNPEAVRRLKLRYEAARQTEQDARREAAMAKQEWNSAKSLVQGENVLQEFIRYQNDRASEINPTVSIRSSNLNMNETLFPAEFLYRDLPNHHNSFVKPPKDGCKISFDGLNQQGRRTKDLASRLFFNHTDERLRMFMKDKDYLRCEGYLSTVDGGFRFLTLKFTFAYPNAREAYGFIEKGSMLTILLLNGDFINLKSGIMDQGKYDLQKEILTYEVQYPISVSQINFLKKSEVDRLRVYWSSGYEEYEIFEMNFFIDQMECLGW